MSTGRIVSLFIEGHPRTGHATLTKELSDGSGRVCLYGVGPGPHGIRSAEDLENNTITLTGRSGKLTTEVVIPLEAKLS